MHPAVPGPCVTLRVPMCQLENAEVGGEGTPSKEKYLLESSQHLTRNTESSMDGNGEQPFGSEPLFTKQNGTVDVEQGENPGIAQAQTRQMGPCVQGCEWGGRNFSMVTAGGSTVQLHIELVLSIPVAHWCGLIPKILGLVN